MSLAMTIGNLLSGILTGAGPGGGRTIDGFLAEHQTPSLGDAIRYFGPTAGSQVWAGLVRAGIVAENGYEYLLAGPAPIPLPRPMPVPRYPVPFPRPPRIPAPNGARPPRPIPVPRPPGLPFPPGFPLPLPLPIPIPTEPRARRRRRRARRVVCCPTPAPRRRMKYCPPPRRHRQGCRCFVCAPPRRRRPRRAPRRALTMPYENGLAYAT